MRRVSVGAIEIIYLQSLASVAVYSVVKSTMTRQGIADQQPAGLTVTLRPGYGTTSKQWCSVSIRNSIRRPTSITRYAVVTTTVRLRFDGRSTAY